jgi:GTP cyclohydrolase IA
MGGIGIVDSAAIAKATRQIIEAIGEDPLREGLLDTPQRIADMYAELFAGIGVDPVDELQVSFDEGCDEMIVLCDIPFYSMCEHHLLPFFGVANIGYIPNGRVVGISKMARVVEAIARRPQLQERMTMQIADVMVRGLSPQGVAVVVEAEHLCMTMRGVKKPGAKVVTSANRGLFRRKPATRAEFFSIVQARRAT